jgi:hypothetical protein
VTIKSVEKSLTYSKKTLKDFADREIPSISRTLVRDYNGFAEIIRISDAWW